MEPTELRLEEEERERAAEVCRDFSALLDKRLYRMRRLYWTASDASAGAESPTGEIRPGPPRWVFQP